MNFKSSKRTQKRINKNKSMNEHKRKITETMQQ